MPKWDVRKLLDDCDLRLLAPAIGIRTNKVGGKIFIECLSGLHHETQINHMICNPRGCFCFSCHCSYDGKSTQNDAISTVRQFRRMYGGDDSFNAACETIAEFLGDRERYLLSDEPKKEVKKPTFTQEDLLSAGLSSDPRARRAAAELPEILLSTILLGKVKENIGKLMLIYKSDDQDLSDEALKRLKKAGALYQKITGHKYESRLLQ